MKLIAMLLLLLTCSSLHADEQRPNILLMVTDDQALNCLGAMGNEHIQTPNMDRIAQRGVLFNNAFVTTAICCSNRACILTGHGLSGKWLMYENSIRVPMIVYDPRIDKNLAGTRRDEMVLSIDLAPTLLALAGLEAPESMQGSNIMPIVKQEFVPWRKHYYYEHTYQTEPPRSPIPRSKGIRTQRWKYIRYPDTVPVYEQLFDLKSDPLEQKNLAMHQEHAKQLSKLRTQCDQEIVSLR
jgi:arylsulfatase A-like enzyme